MRADYAWSAWFRHGALILATVGAGCATAVSVNSGATSSGAGGEGGAVNTGSTGGAGGEAIDAGPET